jgi:hypothetical protein
MVLRAVSGGRSGPSLRNSLFWETMCIIISVWLDILPEHETPAFFLASERCDMEFEQQDLN